MILRNGFIFILLLLFNRIERDKVWKSSLLTRIWKNVVRERMKEFYRRFEKR